MEIGIQLEGSRRTRFVVVAVLAAVALSLAAVAARAWDGTHTRDLTGAEAEEVVHTLSAGGNQRALGLQQLRRLVLSHLNVIRDAAREPGAAGDEARSAWERIRKEVEK